jgi:ABC-2 type transport system permease protein
LKLRPVIAVAIRQYYLLRSSPTRALPIVIWVAVDIILWGFISRYLNSVNTTGINFTSTLLGAVLFWDFFIRVMQGVTLAFFEDVWSRNFINVFATPLLISEYLTGLVLSSIATSAAALVVMLLMAIVIFGLRFLAVGLLLIPFLLLLFLFGIALGVVACSMVLRLGPVSEWLVWPIPALLSPFVGVFYPITVLPAWMQAVGRLMPPTYVFESLRSIVTGHGYSGGALAAGFGLALADILLASWLFMRVYRHAVRTGLLARYSAESAG